MKVVLADVVYKTYDQRKLNFRMEELENLVNTYWWVVIVKKIQKKGHPDYKTFLGSWKLEEIRHIMKENNATVLILWNILKPHQIYNINEFLKPIWAQAWDRVDLILKIFDKHAKTPEAKLQIELASIKHMWPRIFGMGLELSRQWWWIWTKWIWETNIEIMKRHLKERKNQIEKKLKQYEKVRKQHRQARKKKNLNTVWIVGYTNAWKSSLLHALTKKNVLVENKLFATLGTSVWEVFISPYDIGYTDKDCIFENCKKILLNDTIWFIQDLPPNLIKAFKSTLEDSLEADLILHLIDISDPQIDKKIKIVDNILQQIWANQPKIYVFNKIDKVWKEKFAIIKKKYKDLNPIFVSATKKIWLTKLKKFFYDYF